jgi:hypothetical protein
MKSIVQTNVERRVRAEAEKTTLIDTYGPLIGWMKVLADWLLAPAGAVLDGLVLFGIFYLAVKSILLSAILAAIAAIAIQFLYGWPASVAASTAFSGRYEKQGEQGLMWFMGGITIIALGFSLFLSFRSDRLVEAVGEHIYIQEDDGETQQRYDKLLEAAQQQHNTDIAAVNERIAALQNDKIMWKGQVTTRERSSRKAANLSNELTTLSNTYNTRVQQIEEQRQQALQQLQHNNSNTAELFAARVEDGGATLKGVNISFNVVRLAIILVFMYFTSAAATELQHAPTPVATTVGAYNTTTQHQRRPAPMATATTAQPEPERTRVQPFQRSMPKMQTAPQQQPLQHTPTPVATTVGAYNTTPGNTYNVTVVDGAPTLPPPAAMNTTKEAFTLQDIKRYIPTYAKRSSDNAKQIHRELLNMKAILEKETA